MRSRRLISLAAGFCVAAAGVVAAPAFADGGGDPEPPVDSNGRIYYDGAPILPDTYGPVSADSGLDGKASAGAPDVGTAAATCGSTYFATFGATINWSNPTVSKCYILGKKGVTVGYHWEIYSFTGNPLACVQAGGFNSSGKATWYGAGCGTSGGKTAPWGNVAASKKIRGKAGGTAGTPAGVAWK